MMKFQIKRRRDERDERREQRRRQRRQPPPAQRRQQRNTQRILSLRQGRQGAKTSILILILKDNPYFYFSLSTYPLSESMYKYNH